MYESLRSTLLAAYRTALQRAWPPTERVAQHWVDPSAVTWLGVLAEQTRFQLSWSFGRLKHTPDSAGLQTAGVFHLTDAVFPGVEAALLSKLALGLIPSGDGPTASFLLRCVCHLALADVALALDAGPLPMARHPSFVVAVPLRADALETPAAPPRRPAHAVARVDAALAQLEPPLAARLDGLFRSTASTLLEAVRGLPHPVQ